MRLESSPDFARLPLGNRGMVWGDVLLIWCGLSLTALLWDPVLWRSVRSSPDGGALSAVLSFFRFLGGYSIHALVIALLVSRPGARRLLTGYLVPLVLSALLCTGLKYSVGRVRPEEAQGVLQFLPFAGPSAHANSFPSGEATSAMTLAVLLGLYFPRSRWVFVAMAGSACLARVTTAKHFLSDVTFGAGLGAVSVLLSVRWLGSAHYRFDEPAAPRSPESSADMPALAASR